MQLLALFLIRARVGLHSVNAPDDIRHAHLEPVADIASRLNEELARLGSDQPVAVTPGAR